MWITFYSMFDGTSSSSTWRNRGELFYIDDSFDRLLLGGVDVTSVAASSTDIAVTSLNRSSLDQQSSFFFHHFGKMMQTNATDHPLDCASFNMSENLSSYALRQVNDSVDTFEHVKSFRKLL